MYTLEETYGLLRDFVRRREPRAKDIDDEDLDVVLDEVGTAIRNYIASHVIPVGPVFGRPGHLFYVWGGMAVDALRYWLAQNPNTAEDEEIDPRDVQSVKLGDTEVKRGVSASDTVSGRLSTMHMPDLDSLLYNYQHQLNQFRKMRW